MRNGAEETYWRRGRDRIRKKRRGKKKGKRGGTSPELHPGKPLIHVIQLNLERLRQISLRNYCFEIQHSALIVYLNTLLRECCCLPAYREMAGAHWFTEYVFPYFFFVCLFK